MSEVSNIVIIGSGPAGYTAAIYAARANLKPLLFQGLQPGGQLTITTDVENYPGYPQGVTGPAMMEDLQKQAERFGSRVIYEDATSVDLSARPFRAETDEAGFTADSVIVATGASARWLGIESEQRLVNLGVSACATCDGAFFREQKVAIVGGGDTAMEEALFLTRFASKIFLIHRRGEFRASKIMQDRVLSHEKIEVLWNTTVEDIRGDKLVEGLVIKDVNTGEVRDLDVEGFFVAIGHTPNTDLFKDFLDMNETGYIQTQSDSTYTNIEGVFACGDAQDHIYRQAVTAAGTGCMAAIDAERWLADQEA